MDSSKRQENTRQLLMSKGWDEQEASEVAREAEENGESLLESLCFQAIAENLLARIHDSNWIVNRSKNPDSPQHDLINRLLESGASPDDLAQFARFMQRQYLCDLGCVLDGSGVYGVPELPINDFRVVAIDESSNSTATLDDLHEMLEAQDIETEMRLSKQAAEEKP